MAANAGRTIGAINVAVRADSEDLPKDLAKGSRKFKQFAHELPAEVGKGGGVGEAFGQVLGAEELTAGLGKVAAGFTAVAIAAEAVEHIKGALEAISGLASTARRIGTTTEALSELRFVAKYTGTEVESLDNALGMMEARLGGAEELVSGPVSEALQKMGLDAKTLAEEDPAKAFEEIAAGIRSLPTPAERAAAAMQIFGKQGRALLNTLQASPEVWEHLREQAQELGLSVSSIDADQVLEANHALEKIGDAFEGIWFKLAIKLAPYITAFAESVVEAITKIERATAAWEHRLSALRPILVALAGDINPALGAMIESTLEKADGKARELADTAPKAGAGLGILTKEQLKAGDAAKHLAEKLQLEITTFGQTAEQAEIYSLGLKGVDSATLQSLIGLQEQLEALRKNKKAMEEMAASIKAHDERILTRAQQLNEAAKTPLEKYREELKRLQTDFAQGLVSQSTLDVNRLAAFKELKDKLGIGQPVKHAGAIDARSEEARTAVLAFRDQEKQTPEAQAKELLRAQQAQLNAAKLQLQTLLKIERHLAPGAGRMAEQMDESELLRDPWNLI